MSVIALWWSVCRISDMYRTCLSTFTIQGFSYHPQNNKYSLSHDRAWVSQLQRSFIPCMNQIKIFQLKSDMSTPSLAPMEEPTDGWMARLLNSWVWWLHLVCAFIPKFHDGPGMFGDSYCVLDTHFSRQKWRHEAVWAHGWSSHEIGRFDRR